MEKMQRVNVLLPVGLWPALAKAAVNRGHQRASFVRMVLLNACEKPAVAVQSAAPRQEKPYEEPVPPFDPGEEFSTMLSNDVPIPDALRRMRQLCAQHGRTDWKPPKSLHAGFMASYRADAIAAGRNPDEELRLLVEASEDRI